MAEGGMESEDYLKYMAEDSGNVAADGNFSVQVCLMLHESKELELEVQGRLFQTNRFPIAQILAWMVCTMGLYPDDLQMYTMWICTLLKAQHVFVCLAISG